MVKALRRAVLNASVKSVLTRESRTRKRAIQFFANKVGLVYFGYVDQHFDAHKVLHGFTISASHRDNNYSVGTVGDYDIALVDRSDAVWQHNGSISVYKWLIMSFRLKTEKTLPLFFINAKGNNEKHYESMFTVYPVLKPIEMDVFEEYGDDFTSRFEVYAGPADSIEVQRLIPADTARVFGTHFWPISVECDDNHLYLYSNAKDINEKLLETMIQNGLWLADRLDLQIENI